MVAGGFTLWQDGEMIARRTVLAAGLALAAGPALARGGIRIFAAASLQTALTRIAAGYRGSGAPLRLSFGASSAMARQIAQGAPADLFVSADSEWMDWLGARRLIAAGTRRNLLSNRLVLIAPKGSTVRLKIAPGMPLAAALGGGRLAIADPVSVPAGKYGKAALIKLGVWDNVAGRLAPAENVRAALAYVARGETPLGIVYATDAHAEPKVRVVGLFPPATHPRILYPAALTRATPAGQAVLDYLSGPKAMAVFAAEGFLKP
ncbi:molybdate ABC transporter substrate-binding protein [Caulobacter sp. NIBR1757]|uniref:molybdate ABC transporter substrate-binding protein n=1 Tax=Caulobacter sp. NIBR1757 TaxID=3016000 RepID=UPI0022F0B9FC|nr:molybdate ABC transporter substrate-binding protein [Caulobacter sp. NIBR1757]WGM41148.1 Molybdate-binding protein ModA [Caulobacter sp. NIBR1757]